MSIRERHFFFAVCDTCGDEDENFPSHYEARAHAIMWMQPNGTHLCETCEENTNL